MSTLSANWSPPETVRGTTVWTRTWRIVTYGSIERPGARFYVALAPDSLAEGYETLFPFLEERRLHHLHARSPQVLRAMEGVPQWAGKAVVIHALEGARPGELAEEIDLLLAGRGLSGPPLLAGARPIGGRSGLLFTRRASPQEEGGGRRQRLARLLGEGGGG